jgi:hypothetical protein
VFHPTVVLSRTDFSSFTDAQNSIPSKPLVRWGCISNRWKAGRVVQCFGIKFRGRIPTEQPHNLIFFHRWNLSRIAVFSNLVILQKAIAHKPFIRLGQVNTCWKAVDVLYLFGTWLSIRFQKEQHHISIFWLLHAVKTELMLLLDFFCSEVILLDWA